MSYVPGLEGVVAVETQIAEPDRDGGALRYRGVDIEELCGRVPYESVWALLVDGDPTHALAPASLPDALLARPTRAIMAELQAVLAQAGPVLGARSLLDTSDEEARAQLATLSAWGLDAVATVARGGERVPDDVVAEGRTLAERFIIRWRGAPDERAARALDAYWTAAAEHGLNASTFTARVVTSTGADAAAALSAAVGALSGPLHGGAPARVLPMLDAVAASGDADAWVREELDRGERLMGFGHRVYRAEDPRARVLRRVSRELGSPRVPVAEALEQAALAELRRRKPDRVLATNVEFWSAVVLDVVGAPPELMPPLFACSRFAGWSAHVLEQKREGRLIRPSARYVGPGPRPLPTAAA